MAPSVMFVCGHNAARSQMAEGFAKELLLKTGVVSRVESSGLNPTQVHPQAIKLMSQIGLDISNHKSENVNSFNPEEFDVVVSMCGCTDDLPPGWTDAAIFKDWNLEDPEGKTEERFGEIRDSVKAHVLELKATIEATADFNHTKPSAQPTKSLPSVMFVCGHNAARSQMAEGFAKELLLKTGVVSRVESSGLNPTQVHPQAIKLMSQIGLDISNHKSENVNSFNPEEFDVVVSMCGCTDDLPPGWIDATTFEDWNLEDPEGKTEERFGEIRDAVRSRVEHLGLLLKNDNHNTMERIPLPSIGLPSVIESPTVVA